MCGASGVAPDPESVVHCVVVLHGVARVSSPHFMEMIEGYKENKEKHKCMSPVNCISLPATFSSCSQLDVIHKKENIMMYLLTLKRLILLFWKEYV